MAPATPSAPDAVQRASLALECIHNIHGGHGLAARVLGVRHGVADDVLQKHPEHAPGLLVDKARDALHATAASQAANRRLGNALDTVAQHHAVALRAALATSDHVFNEPQRPRASRSPGRGPGRP